MLGIKKNYLDCAIYLIDLLQSSIKLQNYFKTRQNCLHHVLIHAFQEKSFQGIDLNVFVDLMEHLQEFKQIFGTLKSGKKFDLVWNIMSLMYNVPNKEDLVVNSIKLVETLFGSPLQTHVFSLNSHLNCKKVQFYSSIDNFKRPYPMKRDVTAWNIKIAIPDNEVVKYSFFINDDQTTVINTSQPTIRDKKGNLNNYWPLIPDQANKSWSKWKIGCGVVLIGLVLLFFWIFFNKYLVVGPN